LKLKSEIWVCFN